MSSGDGSWFPTVSSILIFKHPTNSSGVVAAVATATVAVTVMSEAMRDIDRGCRYYICMSVNEIPARRRVRRFHRVRSLHYITFTLFHLVTVAAKKPQARDRNF
jgi:hypothetical protein